jgi:hypothetical protein
MEEYRVIKGYENYSVSNYGNVRNDKTGTIFKAGFNTKGYKRVKLGGKCINIHRLVAQAFIPNQHNKPCIDHINTNKADNNVNNLRWVTNQENNYNKPIQTNNTTGAKGIRFVKKANKYEVYISYNNKRYNIGLFDKIEDAVKARQKKANELFKEFTHSSERVVNLNIEIPKNTKLNINIKVKDEDDTEEYRQLEKEFEELLK